MDINKNKSSHVKGLIGEAKFILYFLKKGLNIYKPIDNNSRVDLLIENRGKFKKVQIKYCTPYKGILRIELEHPGKNRKAYSTREIDEIGLYDGVNDNFYLIPLTDILPRKEMWLRVDPLSKKQVKNIHFAEKYKI